jgi:hypothetical protein
VDVAGADGTAERENREHFLENAHDDRKSMLRAEARLRAMIAA